MTVTQETRGRILVMRIERERKRNAIDVDTSQSIDAALNRLDDDDPALWVGVLTGTQTVFSAGTDLKDGAGARTERGGEYGLIRRSRVKPLIAAVEGVAFGGGFEFALACDPDRRLDHGPVRSPRDPARRRGQLWRPFPRPVRALPLHVAKELLITGAELGAERGYHLGLVNRPDRARPGLGRAVAARRADLRPHPRCPYVPPSQPSALKRRGAGSAAAGRRPLKAIQTVSASPLDMGGRNRGVLRAPQPRMAGRLSSGKPLAIKTALVWLAEASGARRTCLASARRAHRRDPVLGADGPGSRLGGDPTVEAGSSTPAAATATSYIEMSSSGPAGCAARLRPRPRRRRRPADRRWRRRRDRAPGRSEPPARPRRRRRPRNRSGARPRRFCRTR